MNKTGIELIAQERAEQIEKHGFSVEYDVRANKYAQLPHAAAAIILKEETEFPSEWYVNKYRKWIELPYKQRLIIAGALIAAEIDNVQATEEDFMHPDLQKAIEEGKTLKECTDIMNIIEIYGSVSKYEKVIGDLANEDKKTIGEFNQVVYNYEKIKKLHDKLLKERKTIEK